MPTLAKNGRGIFGGRGEERDTRETDDAEKKKESSHGERLQLKATRRACPQRNVKGPVARPWKPELQVNTPSLFFLSRGTTVFKGQRATGEGRKWWEVCLSEGTNPVKTDPPLSSSGPSRIICFAPSSASRTAYKRNPDLIRPRLLLSLAS